MKKKYFVILSITTIICASMFAVKLYANEDCGKCTGSNGCTACSNCSQCKHCHVDGGTCGVCK